MPLVLRSFDALLGNSTNIDAASSPDSLYGYRHRPTSKYESRNAIVLSKKRKRVEDNTNLKIEEGLEDQLRGDAAVETTRWPPKKRKQFSGIRLPSLVFPKSQYHDWHTPQPISQEKDVLAHFMVEHSVISQRKCHGS